MRHSDREFVEYVLQGIQEGFRIGFNYQQYVCKLAAGNMKSASKNPGVVDKYLANEREAGSLLGPLAQKETEGVEISPFGVIPKSHQPGKWRLILGLSSPKGGSVNDGISRQLCSLSYLAVDDVAKVALQLGRGAKLAKLDIAKAYRMVPIHLDDRYLMGMKWQGQIYLDSALPFGLRSAPKVFNAVADGLEWVIRSRGVRFVAHYLDDFMVITKPHSDECDVALSTALSTCDNLGCPTAPEKQEGPTTCISFLGIIIDTMAQELCLPVEKIERLQALSKRELLSLIGQLHHACKVVRPGRRFLRRMISLSTIAKELHHHIRVNSSFRSDLAWWYTFLPMTPKILWHMRQILSRAPSNRNNIMIWAACCMCFYGFLCFGEITVPSRTSYNPGAI